jgi:hypothetical protein
MDLYGNQFREEFTVSKEFRLLSNLVDLHLGEKIFTGRTKGLDTLTNLDGLVLDGISDCILNFESEILCLTKVNSFKHNRSIHTKLRFSRTDFSIFQLV